MKLETSLPPGCTICRGASHVATGSLNPTGSRGARRCDCARGQALAAMDYERKHPAKRTKPAKNPKFDGRAAAAGER